MKRTLRTVAMIAVATALVLAATGCDRLEQAFTPDPKIVTKAAKVASPDAKVNGTIAEGLPESFPLWPEANVLLARLIKTPQGSTYEIEQITTDDFDDVFNGFGEGLKNEGWDVSAADASTPELKSQILTIAKEDLVGIVTIGETEDGKVKLEAVLELP